MMRSVLRESYLVGGVLFALASALAPLATAQGAPPDFSAGEAGWVITGGEFAPVAGSPSPVRQDPAHRYVANANRGEQPTYRMGDISNPNLKPWVREQIKKDNDEVLAGKYAFTARSSCTHAGVPGFMVYPVRPVYFIHTPKQVLMIYEGDAQVRRVYLDVPHSEVVKSSWYGESVGHYEGDTLVVDTIGLNGKTYLDNFRTPHSDKLHVLERWRLADEGKTLEVNITIDDTEAFNQPFSMIQRYRREPGRLAEEVCAENNFVFFGERVPTANKPDF